jgi:hypothetical protein
MAYLDEKKDQDLLFLMELSPLQVRILAAGVGNIFNAMKGRKMECQQDYENMRAAEELHRILTVF